jgi:hypothetical protein
MHNQPLPGFDRRLTGPIHAPGISNTGHPQEATMNPHRRRRRRRAAALGLAACAALAAPAVAEPGASYPQPSAVKIGDTPADYPGASRAPVAPAPKTGDTPADYPGSPGASTQSEPADDASTGAPEAGGFDWPSAAIGAAGAGLLIVLAVGGVSVLSRRGTRIAR